MGGMIATGVALVFAVSLPAHLSAQEVCANCMKCSCCARGEHAKPEPPARVVPQQDAPRYEHGVPVYEIEFENTVVGIVHSVMWHSGMDVQFTIGVGEYAMDVIVGPRDWLDQKNYVFHVGEQVEITGARYISDVRDTIIAREISTVTQTMVLRDRAGQPLWNR